MPQPTREQIREREALAQFGLRRCGSCRGVKPRVNFSKASKAWDGLQSYCRDCVRRYREDNREALKDRKRQYYQANREALNEKSRQYYQDNREVKMEYFRQYYQDNREAVRRQQQQYQKSPRGRAIDSQSGRKRRALKAAVNETFTAADEAFVFERDGYRCVDCGITNQEHLAQFGQRLHIDHVLPLSKGHALTRENAALRCRSCNSRKSNQ